MFEELDTVVLNHNIEKQGLNEGSIGTIVHIYRDNKEAEVEFMTDGGKTLAVLTLNLSDLSRLDIRNTSEEDYKYKSSIVNGGQEFPYVYRTYI